MKFSWKEKQDLDILLLKLFKELGLSIKEKASF